MIDLPKMSDIENYFRNNKTQGLMFIALIAVFLLIAYLKLILLPQIGRVTDVLNKVSVVGRDLKSAELAIAKIDKFKRNIDAYKEKVEKYEKMLPAEQEIPNLLQSLSAMAKSSNIKIVGIAPVPSGTALNTDKARGTGQVYREIPILISARSGYHELGAFLVNLENSDRFMKVVDIEIKSNKTTPKKHDVELIVCTYTLLQGK